MLFHLTHYFLHFIYSVIVFMSLIPFHKIIANLPFKTQLSSPNPYMPHNWSNFPWTPVLLDHKSEYQISEYPSSFLLLLCRLWKSRRIIKHSPCWVSLSHSIKISCNRFFMIFRIKLIQDDHRSCRSCSENCVSNCNQAKHGN